MRFPAVSRITKGISERCLALCQIFRIRRDGHADKWLADERAQAFSKVVGAVQVLGARKPVDPATARGINLFTPQIVSHLCQQGLVVGHQFSVKRHAALKCAVAEHALTEGMDRKHSRLIKVGYGAAEFTDRRPYVVACSQKRPHQRIGAGITAAKSLERANQGITKTLAQLAGGRPGIGHHQDVGHRQILFQQQS